MEGRLYFGALHPLTTQGAAHRALVRKTRRIGGSGKQAHSLAGISRKKYWVSGSSETGYRRIFLTPKWRIFTPAFKLTLKKKNRKKLFSPYKIIDSENFIKVSQNPNKVARDTQGLPTVPHNDFGGLNFKVFASNYLLLMTLPPADDDKMKKKSYFRYPNFGKDLGFCILVESLPYKGEV